MDKVSDILKKIMLGILLGIIIIALLLIVREGLTSHSYLAALVLGAAWAGALFFLLRRREKLGKPEFTANIGAGRLALSIALLCFVICNSLEIKSSWIAFVYAVPVACLVLLVLRSAWRDFRSNKWLITGLMWGFLTSLYLSLLLFLDRSVWTIFLLGVPGQIAIFLWFRMLHKIKTGD